MIKIIWVSCSPYESSSDVWTVFPMLHNFSQIFPREDSCSQIVFSDYSHHNSRIWSRFQKLINVPSEAFTSQGSYLEEKLNLLSVKVDLL